MQINTNKTQILTISCVSYFTDDAQNRILSENELNMLGFTFATKPSVQAQIDTLIRKASKRKYMLAKYKNYGVDK